LIKLTQSKSNLLGPVTNDSAFQRFYEKTKSQIRAGWDSAIVPPALWIVEEGGHLGTLMRRSATVSGVAGGTVPVAIHVIGDRTYSTTGGSEQVGGVMGGTVERQSSIVFEGFDPTRKISIYAFCIGIGA
jgi:hypothetical protein